MVDAIGAPLVEYFQALDDPRIDRTKRHHLLADISQMEFSASMIATCYGNTDYMAVL